MRDILLVGKPGAGKDTLAKHLVESYGYAEINMGRILREMAEREDPHGIKLRDEYWAEGNLVPDHESCALAVKYINDLGDKSLVFNGYPRNNVQVADFFSKMVKTDMSGHWDLPIKTYALNIIYIEVSDQVAMERLLKRGRQDDTEETIKTRMNVYESQTKHCLKTIKDNYGITPINFKSGGTIQELYDRFDEQIWRKL